MNPMGNNLYADGMTHEALASFMPFYCGWLDDDGVPNATSVMLAPVFYSISVYGARKSEDWLN